MKKRRKMKDYLNKMRLTGRSGRRANHGLVLLAAVIVFCTTYLMILPAISLDQQTGKKMSGIKVEKAQAGTAGDEGEILSFSGENLPEESLPENISAPENGTMDETVPDQPVEAPADQEDITEPSEEQATRKSEDTGDGEDGTEAGKPESGDEGEDGTEEEQTDSGDDQEESTEIIEDENRYLTGIYTIKGSDFEVSVIVKKDAKVPKDAHFYAKKVTDPTPFIREAKAKLGITDFRRSKFIDMGFVRNRKRVEPKAAVTVRIRLREEIDAQVLHYGKNGVEVVKSGMTIELAGKEVPMGDWKGKEEGKQIGKFRWLYRVRDFFYYLFSKKLREPENTELPSEREFKTDLQFRTDGFSVFAIVEKTYEESVLYSDGKDYMVTIYCPALAKISPDAELSVKEIALDSEEYGQYLEQAESLLVTEDSQISYARFFDIHIMDNGRTVQPDMPVDVTIELKDELAPDAHTLHFRSKKRVELVENTVDQDAVNFEANSFSVYAIIETKEPPADTGSQRVTSVEEIARLGEKGLYVSHPDGYYMTNTTYTVSGSRTGIRKTKPSADSPRNAAGAAKYYFEQVSGKENQFLVYCYDNDQMNKLYVRQSTNALSLDSKEKATTFTITPFHNPNQENIFRIAGSGGYYWNQQGNAGGNGFAAWNDATDTNARLRLEYYEDEQTDRLGLDGGTYGIAWYDASITGTALMGQDRGGSGKKRLAGRDLIVRPDVLGKDGYLLVSKDSDITEWTFHYISNGDYYITTDVDGKRLYLTIQKDQVLLAEEPAGNTSRIHVTPGSGENEGKYLFWCGSNYLSLVNGKTSEGFEGSTKVSNYAGMNLVEKSDALNDEDIVVYTAHKVSASDTVNVADGKQVILYTRIWNDALKRYEFYAVDHDGSLTRCYESGDVIQWVGSKINTALWNFTEYFESDGVTPNYYYELYNSYSRKYIAPQMQDGQVLAGKKIGININGRRYGDDYSTIIAWDDPYYEYAGIRTEDGRIVSCPLSEAEDFYFAVIEKTEPEQLTTVKTIDNDTYGITMKMRDFNNRIVNSRDSLQTQVLGRDSNAAGLLSTNLVDGYPVTNTSVTKTSKQESLKTLFDDKMTKVNHLFIDSTYNESGYFSYDSTQNFARLSEDGNFTVYDQLGAIGLTPKGGTRTHGQFMPYNDLTPGLYTSVTNQTDVLARPLSDLDPRKGEKLYMIQENQADYFFGMEMEASFTQTASGLDAWGHDIIFEFSGDDDFWLYVDGELVLDLGGVHSAMVGNINFRTGEVTRSLREGETGTGKTTLREAFESNYRTRNPQKSDQEVEAYLNGIFTRNEDGQYVFKDYTSHTMKMFYMERGAGASNLKMRFNLAAVKPGTVVLNKTISGTEKADYKLAQFPYQIWYRTGEDKDYRLLEQMDADGYTVTYTGKNMPVKFAEQYTPPAGKQSYDKVFFLKPGQSAEIRMPEDTKDYYITECGINPAIYDQVKANKKILEGRDEDKDGRSDYSVRADTVTNRPQVDYDNHVNPEALRTLTITKKLFAEDGKTLLSRKDDPTPFNFRLFLGGESDEEPSPAYMQEYYVKDENQNYCRWDPEQGTFVSMNKNNFDSLTEQEKKTASFTSSPNGGISKIPADYSVEIRELMVGTLFRVEEWESEMPKGYVLKEYHRVEGSYIGEGNAGTIRDNSDPAIEVHNQRGWGLTVEKTWSDTRFMDVHDPVYFGVYKTDATGNMTLVQDSLRCMTSDTSSLYWFFAGLDQGVSFEQYEVMEVKLENPVTDKEGKVTSYDKIQILKEGDSLTLGGKPKGKEHTEGGYTYKVHYKRGSSTGYAKAVKNVRTDQVHNERPGILLKKANEKGEPLAGAVFTLQDSKGNYPENNHFTSDSTGLITLASLEREEIYTLTEIQTPAGYRSLLPEDKMEIRIDDKGTILINGSDQSTEAYTINQEEDTEWPEITIINKPFTLEAAKIDGETGAPMEGVWFRLFPQRVDVDDKQVRDIVPMMGYDHLTTDEKGIIPRINGELEAGTYYLVENQAPAGYEPLTEDACFTISSTGRVSLNSLDLMKRLEIKEEKGVTRYRLVVSNLRKRTIQILKKGSDNGKELAGAKFSLYSEENVKDMKVKKGAKPTITGTTGDDGILEIGRLSSGTWYLFEDEAPEGYTMPDEPVVLQVEPGRATAYYHENPLTIKSIHSGLYQITVWNNSGYELPNYGGEGKAFIYLAGLTLILFAGVLNRLKKFNRV